MSGFHFGVRFWTPKRTPFCRQNLSRRAKNSKSFDCFCTCATEVFHAAAFPWFCSAAGTCSPGSANIYGLTCSSSRTCVGINVRRAWRTIARGAAKPWEPSGTAVCETSVAYLRKQSKLALFFDRRQKFCRQTAPVLGSRNGPQNGGQVVRTQANQIETE